MRSLYNELRAMSPRLQPMSIRTRLVLLVLSVLIPLLILAVLLGFNYATAQRRVVEAQRVDVATNVMHLLDREVASLIAALQALAAAPEVRNGSYSTLGSPLDAAILGRFARGLQVTGNDGEQLFSTLKAGTTFVPALQAFGGHAAVSNYAAGDGGQGLFFVTVPIASNDGSKRLLSAGVDIDGLSAVFGEAGQPTEWTSAVVDRNGVFLARSKSSQDFVGRLARPQVAKAALRVEVSGVFDNVTYEGVAVSNSFSRSALSGWTSVIAVPTSILEAPMRRSMTLLGWASLASIVASLALAGYAARQIAEPVNGLSAAAEALAAGQSMREPLHRIQEFDAVWTALQRAEAVAQERVRYHAMLAEATVEEFRQKLVVKQALADLEYSERRYRTAMSVGRMGSWETDFDAGIRQWSDEGMSLFGLNLSDGKGVIGGGTDEYVASLHPDDRKLVQQFHLLADHQDEFDAEYRVVRPDGRMLWVAGRGHVAERRPDGSARRLVSIVSDITERKAAEEKIHFLMRELSHRSKNLLAVVQSLAKQTARSSGTFDEFVRRFGDRLQGLAASHDLLVKGDWADAPLGELVSMQLAPFAASLMGQIEMEGPVVPLSAEAAQSIGLALHELATNALKYGALSVPMGKLSVTWWQSNVEGRPVVVLNWCERNGPPVVQPGGKGFGSAVIEGMVARSMNGKVVLDFAPGGLDWTLSFPAPPHSTAA